MGRKTEVHDFYCTKCGKKGIPIPRSNSCQREKHHLKKLFCIYCKEEVNHVECKNEKEVLEFKEKFERGEYEDGDEVNEKSVISIKRDSRIGEDNFC